MKTLEKVAGERLAAFILTLATAQIVNGLFGFPVDAFQVLGLVVLGAFSASLVGYSVGRGLARARFAAAEEYGEAAAAFKKTLEKGKANG